MASHNIIRAALYGYRQGWRERTYVMRLAIVPLIIKFFCLLIILRLDWNQRFLAQALLLLPAYLADGWLQSRYAQALLLDQRQGVQKSAFPFIDYKNGVVAGMLGYALSRYFFAGLVFIVFKLDRASEPVSAGPPVSLFNDSLFPLRGLAALLLLAFGVWVFRFLWFYIPLAVRYPWRACWRDVLGWKSSFYMGGVALVCLLPGMVILALVIGLIHSTLGGVHHAMPMGVQIIGVALRTIMDTAMATISTGAMAYTLQMMIKKSRAPSPLL